MKSSARATAYTDFDGFLQSFRRGRQAPAHARGLRAGHAPPARDGWPRRTCGYAEIIVSAGVVLWKEQEFAADLRRRGARGRAARPWRCAGFSTPSRQFGVGAGARRCATGGESRSTAAWWRSASAAAKSAVPRSGSRICIAYARDRGLRLTAHAGETAGAGIRLGGARDWAPSASATASRVHETRLLRHLRDANIPLEICITSNLVTGVVATLEEHPVRRLVRRRRADRAQHRRSGAVPHHAGSRIRNRLARLRLHPGRARSHRPKQLPLRLHAGVVITCLRDTLEDVKNHQNVTLSLPEPLLRRFRVYAATHNQSMTSLMAEAIRAIVDETGRGAAAKHRFLERARNAPDRGTRGRIRWSREELHER